MGFGSEAQRCPRRTDRRSAKTGRESKLFLGTFIFIVKRMDFASMKKATWRTRRSSCEWGRTMLNAEALIQWLTNDYYNQKYAKDQARVGKGKKLTTASLSLLHLNLWLISKTFLPQEGFIKARTATVIACLGFYYFQNVVLKKYNFCGCANITLGQEIKILYLAIYTWILVPVFLWSTCKHHPLYMSRKVQLPENC